MYACAECAFVAGGRAGVKIDKERMKEGGRERVKNMCLHLFLEH